MSRCYCEVEIPECENKIKYLRRDIESLLAWNEDLKSIKQDLQRIAVHTRGMLHTVNEEQLCHDIEDSSNSLEQVQQKLIMKIQNKLYKLEEELDDMREEDDEYHREEEEDDAVLVNMLDASNNG